MSPRRRARTLRRTRWRCLLLSGEHAEDVVLAQDHVIDAVDLDFGAAVLADEHAITLLDVERDDLAFLGLAARAHRHHLTLLRLLLGGVRNDDSAANGL